MGGVSQNLGEEDTHSIPSKRMEGRQAKVRRTETHDLDRRLSPKQTNASYTNSSSDNPITFDNRLLRDNKDARDVINGNREAQNEVSIFHTDMSGSRTVANVTRLDVRGNEKKDFRFENASDSDFKGNMKFEKDGTELMENNPTKRYSKFPNDFSHSWHIAQQGTHCVDIDGNVHFIADIKDSFKGQVVSADIDLHRKFEENSKEKGRGRRDWRCNDWREKDKHDNDNRSNMQGSSNGKKKLVEEREMDRRPSATNNIQKDNEKREKNPVEKEAGDTARTECLPSGKHIDESEMVEEQETLALEPRKTNDDFVKGFNDEFRGNKQENNLQYDGEMQKICDSHGNEAEDGSNGYGATDKGSDSLGHDFQQCKKIKNSRGSPNHNQKLHFSSETASHERIQGKAEVASIVYKPGEFMSKLLKLWKEFEASLGNKNGDITPYGPILDIRIPPKHVNSTNRQLRYAQMWGTDVYTFDSDVVAVLIHTGYCCPLAPPLPAAIDELRATIRVLPPQDCYRSTIRNNIHSRAWGSSAQCSYRIESCSIVKKGGETIKLEPHFTRISGLEPTIAPLPFERKMITRAAAATNALSQQRFFREVSFQYNLCNEPWIKYSLSIVADKGMRKPLYTSTRLKKGEVLYLETHFNRYELCFNGEKACLNSASTSYQTQTFPEKDQCHNSLVEACDRNATDGENIVDMFRWSRCKKALPENMMRSIGIPLPTNHLVVLEENLEWEDIQWSQAAVWVAGKQYQLARVHFLSPK